jgi:hypothetical protein
VGSLITIHGARNWSVLCFIVDEASDRELGRGAVVSRNSPMHPSFMSGDVLARAILKMAAPSSICYCMYHIGHACRGYKSTPYQICPPFDDGGIVIMKLCFECIEHTGCYNIMIGTIQVTQCGIQLHPIVKGKVDADW